MTRAMALSAVETPSDHNTGTTADRSLLNYKFTNELGQAVSISGFHGQALAITFFFTRCPMPDFCPRLSKNFQEASKKLSARSDMPTNWHFLSVSFDPEFDTPEVLKNYGRQYQYDPAHWSFLTGPPKKIAELAQGSGIKTERESGLINHNFRTLIIDPSGHLQTMFPMGGDLSDAIVQEIRKALGVEKK
ncbi:MAG TPA: SCO family protein [Verrucomicrobiae bacterium]|jgi:protein SCO1/2